MWIKYIPDELKSKFFLLVKIKNPKNQGRARIEAYQDFLTKPTKFCKKQCPYGTNFWIPTRSTTQIFRYAITIIRSKQYDYILFKHATQRYYNNATISFSWPSNKQCSRVANIYLHCSTIEIRFSCISYQFSSSRCRQFKW